VKNQASFTGTHLPDEPFIIPRTFHQESFLKSDPVPVMHRTWPPLRPKPDPWNRGSGIGAYAGEGQICIGEDEGQYYPKI